jgi:hypothetical protein
MEHFELSSSDWTGETTVVEVKKFPAPVSE